MRSAERWRHANAWEAAPRAAGGGSRPGLSAHPRGYPDVMTSRRILALALALLAVGVATLLAADATIVSAVGWALVGFAGVTLVSLAFLLVGESEDRDRLKHPRG
jgi:predicted cobalt transporter CbtA